MSPRVSSPEDDEDYRSIPTLRESRYSQSLERGLAILGCFSARRPVLGIAEIADDLGMHRSTTHRYVSTRVPRTLKEDRCRTNRRMWCCMRDGGAGRVVVQWPSAAVLQEEAANHPELLRSRAVVVSVVGKVMLSAWQVWITKANASKPLMKCRKCISDIKTGAWVMFWDESGGCLSIGQMVSGIKVARAWSGLLCGTWEPVVPRPLATSDACIGLRSFVAVRTSSSGNCEGERNCAGHGGGPTRSSDKGPVMGLERRGRVVLACLAVNHSWMGGAG
jgi:hypothetical protein